MKFAKTFFAASLLIGSSLAINSAMAANNGIESKPPQCNEAIGCPSFTTDQLERMSDLKNQFLDENSPKKAELGALCRHMQAELTRKSVDRDKITSLQNQINTAKADLANSCIRYRLSKLALLTDEQREMHRRHLLLRTIFGHPHHHEDSLAFGHDGRKICPQPMCPPSLGAPPMCAPMGGQKHGFAPVSIGPKEAESDSPAFGPSISMIEGQPEHLSEDFDGSE